MPEPPSAPPAVVAVLGPTGIGKSRVAFELARALDGEVVVADSRQVYRKLDIATNKPEPEARAAVPYHLLDVADPEASFNAHEWVRGARRAVEEIMAAGRLPILEGGTVLYLDALLEGYSLAEVPARPERRRELAELGQQELEQLLRSLDPEAQVDVRNPVRVVRAIEVLEALGPPLARARSRVPPPWPAIRVGLTAPLTVVDRRLAERSRRQVERGLVEETRRALSEGVPPDAPVLSGIGYAEALAHLRGELSLEELPARMAAANRRYARRQLRWLRRDPRIEWFQAEPDPLPAILDFLRPLLFGESR
jgi:tRNA dimethylallyltransferase